MSQLVLPFPLRRRYSFDGFCADGNEELLTRLGGLGAVDGFTCLWLHGEGSCGRTHLLQALCSEMLAARRQASYLPARLTTCEAVLSELEPRGVVCIDDADVWLGGSASEALLMKLYQGLLGDGGALVLSAALPPTAIRFALPDLASRLRAAAVYAVRTAPETQWRALLIERAAGREVGLSDAVLDFWLSRGPRSLSALMNQLDTLVAVSLRDQRRITVPFVRDVLALHG